MKRVEMSVIYLTEKIIKSAHISSYAIGPYMHNIIFILYQSYLTSEL